PQRRLYLADKVVGYRCVGSELRRYEYASLQATLPDPIPATASSAVLAADVAGCTFDYRRGTGTRAGLASLRLRLSLDGESVELIQQVHIDNAP
ncbi:MAG TPA: type II secretion system protein, partial [Pseudomonas sp.]|nr:type II secretion system protein [Pseudomonas sp.]